MNKEYSDKLISLLDDKRYIIDEVNISNVSKNKDKLLNYLVENNINVTLIDVKMNNLYTSYLFKVMSNYKKTHLTELKTNIMMLLGASKINIDANKEMINISVLNEVVTSIPFLSVIKDMKEDDNPLTLYLGKNIDHQTYKINLNKAPHILISGTTGSGKSVCLNNMIMSLLVRNESKDVKLALIDTKKIEYNVYDGMDSLLYPVATSVSKALEVLNNILLIMDERYERFGNIGNDIVCRTIEHYNQLMEEQGQEKLPYIVVVIDELSDLMMANKKETENIIRCISQLARSAGIHLIVATQNPSSEVLTSLIKANIPTKISFVTSSSSDSRKVLNTSGAETLFGHGDALVSLGDPFTLDRISTCYLNYEEIDRVVTYLKSISTKTTNPIKDVDDDLYQDIIAYTKDIESVSISLLQRRFSIGYPHASRLIERLVNDGYIKKVTGSTSYKIIKK